MDGVMGLLSKIRDGFAMRAAARAVQEHPVLKAALLRSSKVFDSLGLKDFSEETKQKMAEALLERVSQIVLSDDKVSTCRFHLTEAVIELATYQVLVLPPYPEEDPTGLRGTQGISGELKPLLLEVSEKNKDIHEMMYGITQHPTYEDVWDAVLVHYWRSYWWAETFNACRVELVDYNIDKDRDWYSPFLHAQCVFEESHFRQDLGLGPAPGLQDVTFVPLMYSTFMNIVLDGEKYPDLAWREYWKDRIEDGTLVPPFPK